jgi:hypothetical protein
MNYNQNLVTIKSKLLDEDLIKEGDFSMFENEKFAKKVFDYFCTSVDSINQKLDLKLHFGFRYNINFNASAFKRNEVNIILINHGLINQIEPLIQKSIDTFLHEGFTVASGFPIDEEILLELFIYLISSYLFYHELGHILQFNFKTEENSATFSEEYLSQLPYLEQNHIYEVDADLFGVSVGTVLILQYLEANNIKLNLAILFNLLTLYTLVISNIFIAFAEKIEVIYYKLGSYPHPIIRTRFCIEQILNIANENMRIDPEYFNMIERRYLMLLGQMHKEGAIVLDYSSLLNEHMEKIEDYMNNIEEINQNYPELTRHRAQNIYDDLGI